MRDKITTKQAKYIANRLQGKNKKQSALQAGYSKNTVPDKAERNEIVKKTLKEALENVGVTSSYMALHLRRGLKVKKANFTSDKKIADNEVRAKYAHLVLKARGDIEADTVQQVNLGLIELPGMRTNDVDKWNSDSNKTVLDDSSNNATK